MPQPSGARAAALDWRLARFAELSARDFHDIAQVRIAVFVVEQRCAFQDLDGLDPACWHLIGRETLPGEGTSPPLPPGGSRGEGAILAYCRLVPPGTKYAEPSIGRVITAEAGRRSGLGRALMREALGHAEKLWPGKALRIGAQRYLERFYAEFGFATVSEPYDEDGIEHVIMLRPASGIPDRHVSPAGQ